MILEENYGNLNVLDKSFLYWVDSYENKDKTMSLKNTLISPESEVKVDPVKPHTMKHLTEILDESNVAFVVFRINKKQICLISTQKDMYGLYYSSGSKFVVKVNPIYSDLTRVSSFNSYKDDAQLKSWLNNIYKEYTNYFETTKKPVWDIIVVYKDINVSKKWDERHYSKQGYIPTPKEKEAYESFLWDYQNAWKKKCEKWFEEHRPDAQSAKDIKNLLMGTRINSFKFKGNVYVLYGGIVTYLGVDEEKEKFLYYKKEGNREQGEINGFAIKYKFKGLVPTILGIYYSTAKNPPDAFSKASYEPLV